VEIRDGCGKMTVVGNIVVGFTNDADSIVESNSEEINGNDTAGGDILLTDGDGDVLLTSIDGIGITCAQFPALLNSLVLKQRNGGNISFFKL
jgi:hypothetical protein